MIKIDKSTGSSQVGIPPAFSERCAVRVLEYTYKPNSKDNMMLTVNIELVGYFDDKNNLQTEMTRGNKTYKLAGIGFKPLFFTITDKESGGLGKGFAFYEAFYKAANPGKELTEINEDNLDVAYLDGLVMQALVSGKMQPQLKQLTDAEKQERIAAGKPAIGDPILDDTGKPIEAPSLNINPFSGWLKPYTGTLPE